MHVHTAPDLVPRKYTDIQLAKKYQAAGMDGFVCKCHQGDTAARAATVSEEFPSIKVYGGIVLNHAVGGLNEASVYACGAMLEHCYYTPYYHLCDWEEILESIRQAGAGHILLSSDLGQIQSPDPEEGMKQFVEKLHESGISAGDIRQMIVANPRELLE